MALIQEGSQGICDIAHNPSCLFEFKNERPEKTNHVQSYNYHMGTSLKSPLPWPTPELA